MIALRLLPVYACIMPIMRPLHHTRSSVIVIEPLYLVCQLARLCRSSYRLASDLLRTMPCHRGSTIIGGLQARAGECGAYSHLCSLFFSHPLISFSSSFLPSLSVHPLTSPIGFAYGI